MKPPNRTTVLVMVAVIVYGIAIAANTVCMATGVYDWRFGQSVFSAMNFITFVMAFVALGRRGK